MSMIGKTNSKNLISQSKKQQSNTNNIYNTSLITRNVSLDISTIGNNIKETIKKVIAMQIEGKCIVNGYIKPNSVEVMTFSSGVVKGASVSFDVVIQCEVCLPVQGMHIKHINKAGIRAELNETPSPVIIFIARDHNYSSPIFADVTENDEVKVRVIGHRFELNDKYISIIAEIVESDTNKKQYTQNNKEENNPVPNIIDEDINTIITLNTVPPPPPPVSAKRNTIKIKKPKITIL
jgi:DNA-directed RNA polymerase subunit E'/Rpb7